jgi:hypothetical protein
MLGGAAGGMNPASPGLPAVDNVYQGQPAEGIPNNNVSAMCVSCHSPVPRDGKTGHFVSHYSTEDGDNRTTTAAGESTKERTSAWSGSGWASKYGNFNTWTSDNTATGEMICESCHNLVMNVAGGNNLLESSLPGDSRPAQPNTLTSATTTLCEGCHVSGTLTGHHAMTGDTLSDGTTLSTADTGFTRGYVNPDTEMGGTGSGVKYPAADTLPCLSCHGNGHSGFTFTGARITQKGDSRDPGDPPGTGVVGIDNTGIDRQYDIDQTGVNRMITNYTPLCDACHKTND